MRHKLGLTALGYGLWLASAALSFWAMLWLRIVLLIDLPGDVLAINPFRLAAIDKFGLVILGAAWLVFLVISESFFRKLIAHQLPKERILRVFAIEALLLGSAYAAHALIQLI